MVSSISATLDRASISSTAATEASRPANRRKNFQDRIGVTDKRDQVFTLAVGAENLVRFDLMTESLNVGRDGRADSLPLEPGCFALQAQEPA
jgi:hypothetical protein